jgi:16S rRNA (cytosine1402-N4)-methyltransferase
MITAMLPADPEPPRRSTPAGRHLPVLLDEVLAALAPAPGEVAVDCTLGFAGHAAAIAGRIAPGGRLIGFDLDPDNLPRAGATLAGAAVPCIVRHSNFAALPKVLAELSIPAVDCVLADLGMSSMQVDDPARGFSYMRPGPLDMRMDRSRGRTAAELLGTIEPGTLAAALREHGDEPAADPIAAALVRAARAGRVKTTSDAAAVIEAAAQRASESGEDRSRLRRHGRNPKLHPAARTFQALRILVNRELANLAELLRVLPMVLRPGGRAAIIAFHSGEDRLVKESFESGRRTGAYERISDGFVAPDEAEVFANPRSRSAKLRWAVRGKS